MSNDCSPKDNCSAAARRPVRAPAALWIAGAALTGLVLTVGGTGGPAATAAARNPGGTAAPSRSELPLDPALIALDSTEGRGLLDRSSAKEGFIPLIMYFTSQDNLGYCGVASATMVLNALPIERPVSPAHEPFHLFTQDNFFTAEVRRIAAPEQVARSGMSLAVLGRVLETFPVDVRVVRARDETLEQFRRDATDVLRRGDRFLLVNFLRKTLRQESGGHISPVAAYNAVDDRFLILDVARYKYTPVWVKSEDLWNAMRTVDAESGVSRGYVVVGPTKDPKAFR